MIIIGWSLCFCAYSIGTGEKKVRSTYVDENALKQDYKSSYKKIDYLDAIKIQNEWINSANSNELIKELMKEVYITPSILPYYNESLLYGIMHSPSAAATTVLFKIYYYRMLFY